jgi:EpsI family protein
MLARWALAAAAFLLAQAALVHFAAGSERPPAPPALSQFPSVVHTQTNQWIDAGDYPLDPDVVHTLGADRVLNRVYQSRESALPVSFLVAWFESQRAGASQPHSPKVCLPASGWTPESTGDMPLATAAGSITVNRYVVANHGERAVVLYWYQIPRGAVAGEWASKFWTVAGALTERRTDTSLVRVVAELNRGDDPAKIQEAVRIAADFAGAVYPLLRADLPR